MNTQTTTITIGPKFSDSINLVNDIMYRVVATTQCYENYGAHQWDGQGVCPQYWKAKGGNEYTLARLPLSRIAELGPKGLDALVKQAWEPVSELDIDFYEEWIIGYELYLDSEETPDEKMVREMREEGYPEYYFRYPIN